MNAEQREELKKIMNAFINGNVQTPPLCTVARNGNAGLVMVLLEKQWADKNCKDTDGTTPLMHAVIEDHLLVVKTLLAAGADLNVTESTDGSTALHLASSSECGEIVDALLAAGADFSITDNHGATALHCAAAEEGGGEIVDALLAAGVDVSVAANNGATALHVGATSRDVYTMNALLKAGAEKEAYDENGSTPLLNAAHFGNDEIVDILLDAGANKHTCDMYGHFPLYDAVKMGHPPVVKTLLAAGADVDMVTDSGQTALHIAATKGNNDIARILLRGGADKDVTEDFAGMTPLMVTVSNGNLLLTVTLLEAGANLTIQDSHGNTALHFAARRVRVDHARLLLRWGADERTVNKNGKTPGTLLDELDDGVNEGERESARQLLARAPADRADRVWRPRGWLVILRKRMDDEMERIVEWCPKKQKSGMVAGGGGNEDRWVFWSHPILSFEAGLFRNVVSFL